MNRRRSPSSSVSTTLRRAMPTAIGVTVIAFLAAYAVIGSNGLLALGDYKRQIVERERQYNALDQKRATLQNRVALLDPRHANPDMVDELVRRDLNVAHPDEIIVPLK